MRVLPTRQYYEYECYMKRRESDKHKTTEEERRYNGAKVNAEGGGCNPGESHGKGNSGGGQRPSAPLTGGRGAPSPTPKGEQPGDKRTIPSTPSASGAENHENAEKRKLNWHSKCLQPAEAEVKFAEEGKGGSSEEEHLVFWITVEIRDQAYKGVLEAGA